VELMSRQPGQTTNKILIQHWRWLEQQGPSYKQQAASCKRQATSLTRKLYTDILQYKGERHAKKRSKKNYRRAV
jgi:hypothetical protein